MADDWFTSLPSESMHKDFLRNVIDFLLSDAVFGGTERSEPVVRWKDPLELKKLLNLEPTETPCNKGELLLAIRNTVKYSVKTGHPYFVNQLYSGVDPYGLAAQWVTDALNASVYTYEVAPVFSVMEDVVLAAMRSLVGFSEGDGMFCPGGSLANGTAMNLARFHHCPAVKELGITSMSRLVLFASEDAHYSVHKMAALLGLGEENVVLVQTDCIGRMDLKDLANQIESAKSKGSDPFMVLATAGTTVLGAFDPLPGIADLCCQHKLWMHVDGAWGGGTLFSHKHRKNLDGIDRADSVVINPHKLLAVPQQCSVLLTRHTGITLRCHARSAPYLFQTDKFYDSSYDTGDAHLQCGRRPDVFKLWLMWKAKGSLGFERHVDILLDLAAYVRSSVLSRSPTFKLVVEPQFVNVCFWFIPPRLQGKELSPNYNEQLHKVAPLIKERMIKKGSLMLGYQPLRGWPNFFRFVVQNSGVTYKDVDHILNELEVLGSDL